MKCEPSCTELEAVRLSGPNTDELPGCTVFRLKRDGAGAVQRREILATLADKFDVSYVLPVLAVFAYLQAENFFGKRRKPLRHWPQGPQGDQ